MFGRQSHSSSGSGSSNLVEFRAGKMNMVGKMVHADTRKGTVYLTQSEDGLMHFCWKDRITGKLEDDLIVFPDDFEFKRVDQCKTGRVYVLKFKTSTRRMFFWMQEPKTEKDDEHCRRVNELMNNPPSAQRGGGGGSGAGNDSGDLQYMLNNMSQQQLMQLFGGVGQMGGLSSLLGSMNRSSDSSRTNSSTPVASRSAGGTSNLLTPENTTVPRTPSAPKGKGSSKTSTLTSGGGGTGGSSTTPPTDGTSGSAAAAGTGRSLSIDLSSALTTSEAINELIADPERAKVLSVHLPATEDGDENKKKQIRETIAAPQFQQALSLFSNALQSAQLGPVVSQFELTPDAVNAAYAGNLEDFVKALEKALPAGASMAVPKDKEKEVEPKPEPVEEADQEMKPSADKPHE